MQRAHQLVAADGGVTSNGQPKVQHLGLHPLPPLTHEHIPLLQVAMQDAAAVQVVEGEEDLVDQAELAGAS